MGKTLDGPTLLFPSKTKVPHGKMAPSAVTVSMLTGGIAGIRRELIGKSLQFSFDAYGHVGCTLGCTKMGWR